MPDLKIQPAAPPALSTYAPSANAYAPAPNAEPLPWIGKLGPIWTALAFVLFVCGLAAMILQYRMTVAQMGTAPVASSFSDIWSQAMRNAETNQRSPLFAATAILGNVSVFGTILWTILDLIRRRGNFAWLVAVIPLTCLGLSFVAIPIYLLAGRKPAAPIS